jgi:hypothetical protein
MTGSRRSFLKLWAAAPALGLSPRAHAVEHSSFDPWVEIRPDHRRHNVAQIHRRAGGRKVLAVIKNNGYGLGVAAAAHAIAAEPAIAGFAVVKLHEAATLRDAGVRKPVLCMGPLGESDLEDAVALDIQPMVYTPVGTTLERIAARRGRPVSLHVCVDTGIGRVGVPYREAAALLRDLGRRRGVTIAGTMMTFTEDPDFDREQLRAFLDMVRPGTAPVTTGPTWRGRTSGWPRSPSATPTACPASRPKRPGQDQWSALPHRGHGLREPLHRGVGSGAEGAHRRRRHAVRLGRRLTSGGPGRQLRRVRLRPADASLSAATAGSCPDPRLTPR